LEHSPPSNLCFFISAAQYAVSPFFNGFVMSQAVSSTRASSPVAPAVADTDNAKPLDAALSALASVAQVVALQKASDEGRHSLERKLVEWENEESQHGSFRRTALQDARGRATKLILAYYDNPNGSLDLSNTGHLGHIPKQIFHLPKLQTLSLDHSSAGSNLCEAIEGNLKGKFQLMLKIVTNIRPADYDAYFLRYRGCTPLALAMRHDNNPEILEPLIKRIPKEELNKPDNISHRTPLDWAIELENENACRLLVEAGANPFYKHDYSNLTPIEEAADRGSPALVGALLPSPLPEEALPKIGGALYLAIGAVYSPMTLEMARPLLALLNASPILNRKFGLSRDTLLTRAAQTPASQWIIPLLLKAGADPTICTPKGESPLILFARSNKPNEKVFPCLLDQTLAKAGLAGVDLQDEEGMTALLWATEKNHGELVLALLKKGANPNLRTKNLLSALDFAVISSFWPICRDLFLHGATYDGKIKLLFKGSELTLIEVAEGKGRSDIVKILKMLCETPDPPSSPAVDPDKSGSLSDVD